MPSDVTEKLQVSSTQKIREVDDIKDNTILAAEIFAEYGNFIRSVIRYRVADPELENDLYQDFFLSLTAKPIPSDVRNIKNYLYRAIINDSFDAIRRVEHYHDRIQRFSKVIKNHINNDLPENALIETEETLKMFKMIERLLPNREAQAISLKFINNGSIEEITKNMSVNKRSVSRYISAGLRKLRKLIDKEEVVE